MKDSLRVGTDIAECPYKSLAMYSIALAVTEARIDLSTINNPQMLRAGAENKKKALEFLFSDCLEIYLEAFEIGIQPDPIRTLLRPEFDKINEINDYVAARTPPKVQKPRKPYNDGVKIIKKHWKWAK